MSLGEIKKKKMQGKNNLLNPSRLVPCISESCFQIKIKLNFYLKTTFRNARDEKG